MSTAALHIPARHRSAALPRGSRNLSYVVRLLVPYLMLTVLLLLAKPALLRPIFPASTAVVGYLLYRRNESYFLSFLLWIYMLAPLLRRLVDWRTSYQEQSMILIAPLLVTLLPGMHLRQRLIRAAPVIRKAALLTLSAIVFGAGVGMIKHPGVNVILATLTWTAPIVLCVFAATVREREMLPRVLTRTFFWGALLLSAYGIYQFVFAPPWDTYWLKLTSSGIAAVAPSFGEAKPFAMRTWSTMNAPGSLASFLSIFILWLTPRRSAWSTLVLLLTCVILLLTMVRGIWIQTAIGLVLLLVGCRPRIPLRGIVTVVLLLGLLYGSLQHLPATEQIQQRLKTFTSLGEDASAIERRQMYHYFEGFVLTTPMGNGLDTTVHAHGYPLDSSLILLVFMTGWVGAICYLAGLGVITVASIRSLGHHSTYRVIAAASVLSGLTQIGNGDVLLRQGGVLLWLSAGLWAILERPFSEGKEQHV